MSGAVLSGITKNNIKTAIYAIANGGPGTTSTFQYLQTDQFNVSTILDNFSIVNSLGLGLDEQLQFIVEPGYGQIQYVSQDGNEAGNIFFQSSILNATGVPDSAGGLYLGNPEYEQLLEIGGGANAAPVVRIHPDALLVATDAELGPLTMLGEIDMDNNNINNANDVEVQGVLTVAAPQAIPNFNIQSADQIITALYNDPISTGASFALTSNEYYTVNMAVIGNSNAFLSTTNADPTLTFGFSNQDAYSYPVLKSVVDAQLSGPAIFSIPLTFSFKAKTTETADLYMFLNDNNPAASGTLEIVDEQITVIEYGEQ